jgi:hypothetical protein
MFSLDWRNRNHRSETGATLNRAKITGKTVFFEIGDMEGKTGLRNYSQR